MPTMKAGVCAFAARDGILFSSSSRLSFCHERTSLISSSLSSPPHRLLLSIPQESHKLQRPIRLKLVFVPNAADPTSAVSPEKTVIPDQDFSLAKVSFGVIGLALGCTLLSYGFGAYFNILPGSEWSALMLTYGFPLAIIGMALKVRNDVIRYRYGDEQHLDEALKRIFQYGQGGGIPRRNAPVLQMIREEVTEDGRYCLVLMFEAKALQLSDFEKRQAKFASFFGPGITAEIGKGENDLKEVRLISNTILQSNE